MMSFAWKAGADPFLAESLYTCTGEGPHGMGLLNAARYCNPEVEDLVRSAVSILDPVERALVLNRADRIFLDDVAMIPLYQRPYLLAIDSMPGSLGAPVADDTSLAIMRALYLGAFMVTPDMEYVPVLVKDVETIVRGAR